MFSEASSTISPLVFSETPSTISPATSFETPSTISPATSFETSFTISPLVFSETPSTISSATSFETSFTISSATFSETPSTISPLVFSETSFTISPLVFSETSSTISPLLFSETSSTISPVVLSGPFSWISSRVSSACSEQVPSFDLLVLFLNPSLVLYIRACVWLTKLLLSGKYLLLRPSLSALPYFLPDTEFSREDIYSNKRSIDPVISDMDFLMESLNSKRGSDSLQGSFACIYDISHMCAKIFIFHLQCFSQATFSLEAPFHI